MATCRAETQLLANGPVPAQEAVFWRHLVGRAALARQRDEERVKLYLPKDAEAANVSKATATRALNKLRTAASPALPFAIATTTQGGKSHVALVVPPPIGGGVWTERRACLALTRATLAEERKKQGGSQAAVRARWHCRHHPDAAVVETVNRHYRCIVDGCEQSWSPPATVVRHAGQDDQIQVESGPIEAVELHSGAFAPMVSADPIQVASGADRPQVDVLSSREEAHQLEAAPMVPLTPVAFVSDDDRMAAHVDWRDPIQVASGASGPSGEPMEAVPELPPAPTSHLAYWARPGYRELMAPSVGAGP